jgi:hypothetical protein
MIAIFVKILPPTNKKWKRLSVSNGDLRKIYHWHDDYGHSQVSELEENCVDAFQNFCKEFRIGGTWYGGHTKEGMVFVCQTLELKVVL